MGPTGRSHSKLECRSCVCDLDKGVLFLGIGVHGILCFGAIFWDSGSHVKAAGLPRPAWSSLEARLAVGQANGDEVGRLDQDCYNDLFTHLRQVRRPHGHVLLGEIDGPGR